MKRLLVAPLVALLLAVIAPSATAGTTSVERMPTLTIQGLNAEPDGTTRLTVRVSGLEPGTGVQFDRLEIVENGRVVDEVSLADTETEQADAVVPAVVLALDTSGSTQGGPLTAAKDAAVELAQQVTERGGLVGVVGFGGETRTIAPLSGTADAASAGIATLDADGGTALRDAVARAARILSSHDGPRDVIVFSDGEDTTSGSSLDDVRALLAATGVRVTSVVLRTESFAIEPLEALAAVNGGEVVEVTESSDLGQAFERIAGDLTNRLDVVWTTEPVPSPEPTLNVVASYTTDSGVVSDGTQVDNPRLAAVTPPVSVRPPAAVVPFLTSQVGLVTSVVGTGLAAFLLLFLILAGAGERRRQDELDQRLSAYQSEVQEQSRQDHLSLSDRASTAFEAIPRPHNLDSRIAADVEKADWPLRVNEFILLTLGAAVAGAVLGGVLLGSLLWTVLGAASGIAGPWLYLQNAISRRQSAFADQLPTVLQVFAGALRAGHAFSTALDGAVDEVDEPAKSELRRASVEARLGRPLDRALEGVAKRMDSEDLQWVIGALEVQREVGGNLAEILNNVADTLRDRASVARHVKALTAEGRLSAVFIGAMPFVMFAYLSVTNPDYVRPLFTDPIGQIMLVTGLVLLVVGVIVLRRLVQPKY